MGLYRFHGEQWAVAFTRFNPAELNTKLNTLVFESRSQIETLHPLMSKHSILPCRRLKHRTNYSHQQWCQTLSLLAAERHLNMVRERHTSCMKFLPFNYYLMLKPVVFFHLNRCYTAMLVHLIWQLVQSLTSSSTEARSALSFGPARSLSSHSNNSGFL